MTDDAGNKLPNATAPPQAPATPVTDDDDARMEITEDAGFGKWLAEQYISLAFTTYQSGQLFLVGVDENKKVAFCERLVNRCMGLWANDQHLWMSGAYQLWHFTNIVPPGSNFQGHDRLFVPRAGYTTAALDIHDVAVESSGRVIFVNTLFNCLATLAPSDSFSVLWRPPFISELVADDRCHLNGVAIRDGRAHYMTAVSTTNVHDGWREQRVDGGVALDIRDNRVLARGLSMPHSPRFYRGRLWVLNSGTGHFGTVNLATGRFEAIAFCAGFMRGLAFNGDYAIIGLSRPRHEKTFKGLPLDDNLSAMGLEPSAGLDVIDLRTGQRIHWLRIKGSVSELYDVATLPGVVKPLALGFKTREIEELISINLGAVLQETPMSTPLTEQSTAKTDDYIHVYGDEGLPNWLREQRIALAFTTYQSSQLIFVGAAADGELAFCERLLPRCMGMAADGQDLWIAGQMYLWHFTNVLAAGTHYQQHDRLYVPRVTYNTGALDLHDVAVESDGRVVFVNTLFNCLGTLSDRESFARLWRPPFISESVAQDRCHLNGLALRDGKARYMTAVSTTNVEDGWREHRADGGVVMDIVENRIIASGLSMPHSPRYHQGRLWVLNSGAGYFGSVDLSSGRFEPMIFCPGYMRGLAFVGDYALIGLSRPRANKSFTGLPLDENLKAHGVEAVSGIHIVDLRTGQRVHWLAAEGSVSELYDVAVLPGVMHPLALGFKNSDIGDLVTIHFP